MRKNLFINVAIPIGIVLSASPLAAGEEAASDAEARGQIVDLDPVRVVGGKDTIELLPGAAAFIDHEEFRLQGYDNIEQLIRQVPGAYFRTEDGFGLFPNISLRGVGTMRSTSVTIMEDNVLSAPAPYANPAAYYTPTSGRMDGVEVLKGSSQVRHGPHTTGGVINYLSTPVPNEKAAYARGTFGENNEFRSHTHIGETVGAGDGTFGYLLENYYRSSDGFKTIDGIGAMSVSGQTGFRKNEPMFKARWGLPTEVDQSLELKIGYTDMMADETYLGLSEDDFQADPFRRYSTTMFDRIDTENIRTYLRHRIDPTPDSRLVTTGYFNEFSRSWYKLHDVNAQDGEGNVTLSEALAGVNDGRPLDVLRGERDGTIRVRDNNREYRAYGLDSVFQHQVVGARVDHNFEVGVRVHEDYEDRFQHQDVYEVSAFEQIALATPGAPGSQADRRATARSMALHVRDRIEFDRWSVTPGVRYEHIRLINEDNGNPANSGRTSLDVVAPGIGATYAKTDELSFFGGVHRGFSTPSPSSAVNHGTREESSIGYELGARFNRGGFQTETVLFLTDFSDLIVRDSIGGAGSGMEGDRNVGEVRSMGLEWATRYDPSIERGWAVRNPNRFAITLTDATLRTDGGSGDSVESIFGGGERGNRVPYIPTYQVSAGTGLEIDNWGVYLDTFFVPWTYADASNRGVQERPDGTPDSRFGKSDSYFLVDLSVHYRFTESAKLIGAVQNLFNEEYVASRLPHGPRPGAPRFASIGLEVTF